MKLRKFVFDNMFKGLFRTLVFSLPVIALYLIQNKLSIAIFGRIVSNFLTELVIFILIGSVVTMTILANLRIKTPLYTGVTRKEIFQTFLTVSLVLTLIISLVVSGISYLGIEKTSSGLIFNIGTFKSVVQIFTMTFAGFIFFITIISLFVVLMKIQWNTSDLIRNIILFILGFIIYLMFGIFYVMGFDGHSNIIKNIFIISELLIIVLSILGYRKALNYI